MNNFYVNKHFRRLCLAVTLIFSLSVAAQSDFSTIRTGVNAADAKIIEQGIKVVELPKGSAATRGNGFDNDNKDHGNSVFGYEFYRYTYPTVNAKGQPITLSALAAMPKAERVIINNIILGCHSTITDNASTPSEYVRGNTMFSEVGMLTMHARFRPFERAYTCLVILPDYQGYGLTRNEAHPYLVEDVTARQSVDALRYGIELYKTCKKKRAKIRDDWKTLCVGYSQGGAVAMACQRFIETNSLDTDLHLGGSVCGDGPYNPIATLRTYLAEDKVYMPVALPLIIKGMLDYSPYMRRHKASDYFNKRFLDTGILDWIAQKEKTLGDIHMQLRKTFNFKRDERGDYLKASEILKPEAFAFMAKKMKGEPTGKNPKYEDLYAALAENNLTEGWKPKYPIYLLHSRTDEVVPIANAESAYNNMRTDAKPNIIKYTYLNKGNHGDTGKAFYFSVIGKCYEVRGIDAIVGGEETWNKFNP